MLRYCSSRLCVESTRSSICLALDIVRHWIFVQSTNAKQLIPHILHFEPLFIVFDGCSQFLLGRRTSIFSITVKNVFFFQVLPIFISMFVCLFVFMYASLFACFVMCPFYLRHTVKPRNMFFFLILLKDSSCDYLKTGFHISLVLQNVKQSKSSMYNIYSRIMN